METKAVLLSYNVDGTIYQDLRILDHIAFCCDEIIYHVMCSYVHVGLNIFAAHSSSTALSSLALGAL